MAVAVEAGVGADGGLLSDGDDRTCVRLAADRGPLLVVLVVLVVELGRAVEVDRVSVVVTRASCPSGSGPATSCHASLGSLTWT